MSVLVFGVFQSSYSPNSRFCSLRFLGFGFITGFFPFHVVIGFRLLLGCNGVYFACVLG